MCAHRLRADDGGDDGASAVDRARRLARLGVLCADVDVREVEGALVVAHPSEGARGASEARATLEAFARDRAGAWMSFELKGGGGLEA